MTLTHLDESLCNSGDRLASPVINAPVGQLAQAVTLSLWRTWVRIPSGVQNNTNPEWHRVWVKVPDEESKWPLSDLIVLLSACAGTWYTG